MDKPQAEPVLILVPESLAGCRMDEALPDLLRLASEQAMPEQALPEQPESEDVSPEQKRSAETQGEVFSECEGELAAWAALGLRGRRRLCLTGRVFLQGRPCAPNVRLRAGQRVTFPERGTPAPGTATPVRADVSGAGGLSADTALTGDVCSDAGAPAMDGCRADAGTAKTLSVSAVSADVAAAVAPYASADAATRLTADVATAVETCSTADRAGRPEAALAAVWALVTTATAPRSHTGWLVASSEDLAGIFKPSGLHSAQLAGSDAPSLEGHLAAILRGDSNAEPRVHADGEGLPCLLNRLDQPTSGLVLVALSPLGLRLWHEAQNSGHIVKRYLALTQGLPPALRLDRRLDTAHRRRTRVLDEQGPRTTQVTPLADLGGIGLVGCALRQGARHQIRAHLASAGYPLLGDQLYGATDLRPDWLPAQPDFFLHHALCAVPGFHARCLPLWFSALDAAAQTSARLWLEQCTSEHIARLGTDGSRCP